MYTIRTACFLALLSTTLVAGESAALLERLEARIDKLEKHVMDLQDRVDQLEARKPAMVQAAAVQPSIIQPAVPVVEENAPAMQAAKSESGVKLGPVSINGDLRLYFDTITRTGSPDAARVQNIRGRYSARLDFTAPVHRTLDLHLRLASGIYSNPLTDIQDFGGGVAKNPIGIAEAYADFHPNPFITLQGGRVDSPFNDKSRFLFDLDTRFDGTTEFFRAPVSHDGFVKQVQFIAGQYTFTNPNFAIITPGTPSVAATATPSQAFLAAGAVPGTQPRSSQLFQQGVEVDENIGQTSIDFQIYRNPNQLRLMTTAAGAFLVTTTNGIAPGSVIPSPGNATTTPGGAMLTASHYQIGHVSQILNAGSVRLFGRAYPLSGNVQWARNFGASFQRDAMLAGVTAGRAQERGDIRIGYGYFRKDANSLISELTEYDIAVGSNVNMQAHVGRVDFTLAHGITFTNNFFLTTWLKDSDPARNFYVTLGRTVPAQFRYQGILTFRF